ISMTEPCTTRAGITTSLFLNNPVLFTTAPMNVSATFNVFRLLANPALCLPQHTVATFDQLPIPLSLAFANKKGEKPPDIRAVILDKDNCFSVPKQNVIYPVYQSKFDELKKAYPGSRLLIVSNSSGTGSDPGHKEAELLERNTGIRVLRHSTKKPGCHGEIMDFFRSQPETGVTKESQVAVVGDRLFTDVMMANMMGAHGIWIKDGVIEDHGIMSRFEKGLSAFLLKRGFHPPPVQSDFE
ncbi:HAD-superfamily phosphatase, partial [Hortaea werneckii]